MKKFRKIRVRNILTKTRELIVKIRTVIYALLLLLLKYILAYTYIIIVACGGVMLFRSSFLSKSVDTTLFTNIGFGLFAVIANVCFSWARTFSSEQTEIANKISFQGERLFLSALCFLVASFLKYLYFQKSHIPVGAEGNVVNSLFWFVYAVFFAWFIYAYIMATAGAYELFIILFRRHIKVPNIDALATSK